MLKRCLLYQFSCPAFHFQLSDHGVPVVLQNTPFDEWKSTNWTFELLADCVQSILAKKSKNKIFRYHAVDKPLSGLPEFKEKKSYREKKYSGNDFFRTLTNTSASHKHYASGGLELLQIEDVFTSDSLLKVTFGDFEPGQVNFWFGSENVTAYTHYDTSYNLHTVIQGRKKFLLLPPSAYKHLKLYPSLHTFYRQIQVDILNMTQEQFRELLFETPFLEVLLTQGETLYIPPYWFHCVVSLEATISVNVWSQSDTFLSMEDIYTLPIPFEEVWGRVKLMRVLQHFAMLVVRDSLPHYKNVSHFVNIALVRRYELLLKRLSETNRDELLLLVKVFCLQSEVKQLLDTPSLRHVTKGANKIIDFFKGMLPLSVREINVVNYLEHVAWRILGTDNVALVPFYYMKCFI